MNTYGTINYIIRLTRNRKKNLHGGVGGRVEPGNSLLEYGHAQARLLTSRREILFEGILFWLKFMPVHIIDVITY